MKVLISGGAGFLGSHLCDHFIKQGDFVICVDNFITGQERNIKHLLNNPNFELMRQDIAEKFEVKHKLDAILDFASPASPKDYLKYPIETLRTGAYGTHNLLELALKNNARFLLASTSEVYGDPLIHPQVETYWGNVNPVGPRAVYDESKRFAEAITITYHRELKIDVKIARIFNTYGPRMRADDGRIVPNLICQALRNEPLTIYGDGKQTRSFCYVSDLITGITKLLESNQTGPINLGNPDEFDMLEFADLVLKYTKAQSQIIYEPLPVDDPRKRKPDITLAKKYLNWQPEVKLVDGLKPTIEWFKSII
ncbi:MAG: SDR family oxidoreductase [Candidatus Latescibacteria bacterium]|nr:SDR family oxidoreductase [Candidatus Latescibacterota bacterium]